MDVVYPPHALVEAAGRLRLNARYYIIKQIIPALERVLSLVGADVRAWYAGMSRPQRLLPQKRPPAALPLPRDAGPRGSGSGGTIDRYYLSRHCAVRLSPAGLIMRGCLLGLGFSFGQGRQPGIAISLSFGPVMFS